MLAQQKCFFSLVFAATKHRSLIHQNLFTPFANLFALLHFLFNSVNNFPTARIRTTFSFSYFSHLASIAKWRWLSFNWRSFQRKMLEEAQSMTANWRPEIVPRFWFYFFHIQSNPFQSKQCHFLSSRDTFTGDLCVKY